VYLNDTRWGIAEGGLVVWLPIFFYHNLPMPCSLELRSYIMCHTHVPDIAVFRHGILAATVTTDTSERKEIDLVIHVAQGNCV
jgi:hypothetical protein